MGGALASTSSEPILGSMLWVQEKVRDEEEEVNIGIELRGYDQYLDLTPNTWQLLLRVDIETSHRADAVCRQTRPREKKGRGECPHWA